MMERDHLDDFPNEEFSELQVIMDGNYLGKKDVAGKRRNYGFEEMVFSWSLDDIVNDDLYKHQVEKIPLTFKSEHHYVGSFVYPLLEETRAELASAMEIMYRAPYAEIFSINETKKHGKMQYDITVNNWRNRFTERGKEPYKTLPGDLLILADGKPESISDLKCVGRFWAFSVVNNINENHFKYNFDSTSISLKASQEVKFQKGMFVVFLMINITTNTRIWNSLHMKKNMNIIKEVLYADDAMVKECCDICSVDDKISQNFESHLLDRLNESQAGAIRAALCKTECCHSSFVEQIWGPPGTGKTTTVSVLLFHLLQMNRRTLMCAPTNVAIVQVASRVLTLVKESSNTTASGDVFYCIGGVLLFGNKQLLKVGVDIEEIYLENRVKRLTEFLSCWKHYIRSVIDLLKTTTTKLKGTSFLEFVRDRFCSCVQPLKRCILTFLTHVPRSFLREDYQNMVSLLDDLSVFESLLFEKSLVSKDLEQLFISEPLQNDTDELGDMSSISFVRAKTLSVLETLHKSLKRLGFPNVKNRFKVVDFCFRNASMIFCTTSTSYKLHTMRIKPLLEILVIDEAAQLKEAESTIPLQLWGMKHAILIGDDCQLPAMVSSNVCMESGFGRSLFGRLSSLGHSKHLLNVQYRMHPSISLFPNYKFYQNQIVDAENVTCKSYEKQYLPGPMFGSYSFINVVGGGEEKDDDEKSQRNMVEVAIVIKIVQNLYKAWQESKRKITIGVVSPYAAQVVSIQEKLAYKYEKLDGFSVKVKSVDGFQGGEEDIIILSTVRSSSHGSVGFLSSPQRTNVALTRARHCLWILGNERTLMNGEHVWKELVCDARDRHCLFDADADVGLRTTILDTMKALDQLDDLVNENSILFKHEKWKVLFSDDFKRSFRKLASFYLKNLVLNLLSRLAGGWRPKNRSLDVCCGKFSHFLNKFKVANLYIICSVDIIKEVQYIQVLKIWDILPWGEIPKLSKRLESEFSAYTDDYIKLCMEKCLEGDFEVPMSWLPSEEIIKFRSLINCEGGNDASVDSRVGRIYVENSNASESFIRFWSDDYIVAHDRFHVERDFDHFNNNERYAWEVHNESSSFGRMRYLRDESSDQFDRSNLRYQILEQRRDNNVGGLSLVISREHLRDNHTKYYPNEEQFGRSRGHEFGTGRFVDHDVDRNRYHVKHDFDHYNYEGYPWDDQSESSSFGRIRFPRDKSPDRFDRISMETRDNYVGGLSLVASREPPRDRDNHYDRHLDSGHLGSSRVRGRIKTPSRSMSPGFDHASKVEREIDMGRRQRSSYLPKTRTHASSKNSRFRERIKNVSNSGFTGPKRLSELKSKQTDDGQTLGKRKYSKIKSQPDDKLSFEGPKPLGEILKRKRGSVVSSVINEDNNSKEIESYVKTSMVRMKSQQMVKLL